MQRTFSVHSCRFEKLVVIFNALLAKFTVKFETEQVIYLSNEPTFWYK